MKIVTVIGARPQFIKAAMVSKAILKFSNVEEVVVHTGQHYDDNMSNVFFEDLNISQPNFNLGIGSGLHGEQTGKMLEEIEKILLNIKPEYVLVYGDTNSTLAGALAAVKLHISLAHVEAGLRSFNKKMPEEVNRIITDRISDFLFSPTITATNNLLSEGVFSESIYQVGDVMYDAALYYGNVALNKSKIISYLSLDNKDFVLVTLHRAENTDSIKRLANIFEFLCVLAKVYTIIIPLHPRTKEVLMKNNMFTMLEQKLHFIEPVGYFDMIKLEKNANFIVTDSGGVQKEAFFYKKPCITLRDETEWVELEQSGWNKVISPNENFQKINMIVYDFIKQFSSQECNAYGAGNSADLIIQTLLQKAD